MLLAIETSTNVCSVAFQNADGEIFEERFVGRSVHSEKLFLSIEKLMSDHSFLLTDLEGVLVSNGPGSYTGLRIAASGIKGLLFEDPCPLFAITTFNGFAMSAHLTRPDVTSIHSVIDARRTHLYYQQFEVRENRLTQISDISVEELDKVNKLIESGDCIIGTGIERLDESLTSSCTLLNEEFVTAIALIRLYHMYKDSPWIVQASVQEFEPNYYTSNQVNNSITKSS